MHTLSHLWKETLRNGLSVRDEDMHFMMTGYL